MTGLTIVQWKEASAIAKCVTALHAAAMPGIYTDICYKELFTCSQEEK